METSEKYSLEWAVLTTSFQLSISGRVKAGQLTSKAAPPQLSRLSVPKHHEDLGADINPKPVRWGSRWSKDLVRATRFYFKVPVWLPCLVLSFHFASLPAAVHFQGSIKYVEPFIHNCNLSAWSEMEADERKRNHHLATHKFCVFVISLLTRTGSPHQKDFCLGRKWHLSHFCFYH